MELGSRSSKSWSTTPYPLSSQYTLSICQSLFWSANKLTWAFSQDFVAWVQKVGRSRCITTGWPFPLDTTASLSTLQPPSSSIRIVFCTLQAPLEIEKMRSCFHRPVYGSPRQGPAVYAVISRRWHPAGVPHRFSSDRHSCGVVPVHTSGFSASRGHDSPLSLPRVSQSSPPIAPAPSGEAEHSGESSRSPDQMRNPGKYLVGTMMRSSTTLF